MRLKSTINNTGNDQAGRYWEHIRKLAHLGLPPEALGNLHAIDQFGITAEKLNGEIVLKITFRPGEHSSVTIATKDLLNSISNYRRIARTSKSEYYTFDNYAVEHIFGLINQENEAIKESARTDPTLRETLSKALELSRQRHRAIDHSKPIHTRRPLRILAISMRSYPFGGGESWMMETSSWLQEQGHHVIMINFKEPDWGLIPFNSCQLIKGIPRIGIEMVDTDQKVIDSINELLSIFVPDIVHTQGEVNSIINQNYNPGWPPLVCGYHFWNGIVNLGRTGNKKMLSDKRSLSLNPHFSNCSVYPRYHPYIVSHFMEEVMRNAGFIGQIQIVSPAQKKIELTELSSPEKCSYDFLQLNCSILKGGISFIKLAAEMRNARFYGLCALWEELEELYRRAMEEGLNVTLNGDSLEINKHSSIRWTWVDNVDHIICESRVLLSLSLVDETYGRVIPEAIQLGRPVIASNNGNHRYLLHSKYLVDPEDITSLAAVSTKLIQTNSFWSTALREQRQHLIQHTSCGKEEFTNFFTSISPTCFLNHVAILAPWSEQGLGYHAKTYADALRASGIEPHIYSFQSYAADNIGLAIQSKSTEWDGYDVHYSYNHRESLTAREIHQFCMHKNCKVVLALEICWEVNWMRLKELQGLGLDVILIPNPETIRKSEISMHSAFPRVLCTTKLVEIILNDNNVTNTAWIGHGYGDEMSQKDIQARIDLLSRYNMEGKVVLTHISGYNHKRKMTVEVIKALTHVLRELPHINLRILSQKPFESDIYSHISGTKNIQIIQGSLSHNEIMNEYHKASFSLQLSTHEGLGLGFYESISCGTPVITIDKQPHNEPIIDGETGLLIKAHEMTLYDNNEALITGGIFSSAHLASVVNELNPTLAINLSRKCISKHSTDLSLQSLSARLIEALQPFI